LTLNEMRSRPASTTATKRPVADAMDASGLRVSDDMTVEVALSVMTGARAGHLLICDEDSQCTGHVTQAQLTAVSDGSAYTDRLRLRDIAGDSGPLHLALTTTAEAGHSMRYRRRGALSVVDEHSCAPGVSTLSR
jgi:CBS-domain-containing membrane protein